MRECHHASRKNNTKSREKWSSSGAAAFCMGLACWHCTADCFVRGCSCAFLSVASLIRRDRYRIISRVVLDFFCRSGGVASKKGTQRERGWQRRWLWNDDTGSGKLTIRDLDERVSCARGAVLLLFFGVPVAACGGGDRVRGLLVFSLDYVVERMSPGAPNELRRPW